MGLSGIKRLSYKVISQQPHLEKLISVERGIEYQLSSLSFGIKESSKCLKNWGADEQDGLDKMFTQFALLSIDLNEVLDELHEAQKNYREKLKEIKKHREKLLYLTKKLAKVQKTYKPSNPIIESASPKKLDKELFSEITEIEMQLEKATFVFEQKKRELLGEGLEIKYRSLSIAGKKLGIIGEFGIQLSSHISSNGSNEDKFRKVNKLRENIEAALWNSEKKTDQLKFPKNLEEEWLPIKLENMIADGKLLLNENIDGDGLSIKEETKSETEPKHGRFIIEETPDYSTLYSDVKLHVNQINSLTSSNFTEEEFLIFDPPKFEMFNGVLPHNWQSEFVETT